MLTISVAAARAQVQILSQSPDPNVVQYARDLASQADVAVAAGKTDFDLAQSGDANLQSADEYVASVLAKGSSGS